QVVFNADTEVLLVFDNQDVGAHQLFSLAVVGWGWPSLPRTKPGRVTEKVVPVWPSLVSIWISPPRDRVTERTRYRPNPVPGLERSSSLPSRTKRPNTLRRRFGGIPWPLSLTITVTRWPLLGVALM